MDDSQTRDCKAFGTWQTEDAAAAEFDARIARSGLFERTYQEVEGQYLARRPGRESKDARIDRVLVPGKRLRDAGWTMTIGVEIKRSGADIGPAISQAIDYTYCAWHVRGVDVWLYCERIFLWPFRPQHGSLASVMVQNGIGTICDDIKARPEWSRPLIFTLEKQVITLDGEYQLDKCSPTVAARKVGSR